MRVATFGLALFAAAATVNAITVTVEPNTNECFFEELKTGDTLSVSFEVGFGGDHKIDFSMLDATGRVVQVAGQQNSGFYTVTADRDGSYYYCFNNLMNDNIGKQVSFYIHEDHRPKKEEKGSEPLAEELRQLSRNVLDVREHQDYIIQRERMHRNTAESTNDRVKWWSIFETAIVLGVAFFQVNYLKRFFEVKRMV
ncbi:supernatant protein factor C-terminal domain-containing protein [Thamnocephalis sphaerospora]|uniref:Supernatant protein factor C-terminal domain-containing protein n=1 Tax=Thamnocephalis sphaerospora TaxID=78915 RepID=A0A4P9XK44_9FUNG|nr:supernatant protein factor C-terminal domain-containing protein [Thamnocephalis sphaerospora]|eukprot:RKP06168.1 supernatant protein factor C-terminal domain-containing protein [Thamnocephalis sphaerospora]